MTRSTMTSLIAELRQLTFTGINDYAIGATYYWSDDQLEDVLDRHSVRYNHVVIAPETEWNTGGAIYKTYRTNIPHWEGTATTYLQDATGGTVSGASYTFDANAGVFTFTATTGGAYYYVTGYAYDLNRAAAEVWRIKAAHAAIAYDVSTDNHNLKRSQIVAQALQMAQMYDNMAGPGLVTLTRSDVSTE